MSDSELKSTVDAWLQPLADGGCGSDPEYDNDFQVELVKAANGKEATQFDPAGEPPDWRRVRSLAEGILERCRDVRVAIYWARAMLHLDGAATLADSMRLVHGLLANLWDGVHPVPEDGDAWARCNALNDMSSPAGLLGDLRQSLVISNRAIGEVSGRDIEVALGLLEPRADEMPAGRGQLQQMFVAACDADPALRAFPVVVKAELDGLTALMREKVDYASAPSFAPLLAVVDGIIGLLPTEVGASGDLLQDLSIADTGGAAPAGDARPRAGAAMQAGLSGAINSRIDALRAIDMVCDYLERTEPTNPAQLLLRRARRLVDKNFLELVREFAPASVEEVARILGVSPDDSSGTSY